MRLRTKIVVVYGTIFLFLMALLITAASLLVNRSFERVHQESVQNLQRMINSEYKRLGKRANSEVTKIARSMGAQIVRALGPEQNVREIWRQVESGTSLDILELGDGRGVILASAKEPARFGIEDREALKLAKKSGSEPALRMVRGNKLALVSAIPIPSKDKVIAFVVGGYYLKDQLRLIDSGADFVFLLEGKELSQIYGDNIPLSNVKAKLLSIARTSQQKEKVKHSFKLPWFKSREAKEADGTQLPKLTMGNRRYTIGVVPLKSHDKGEQLGAIIAAFSDIHPKTIQRSLMRSLTLVAIIGIFSGYIAGYFIAKSVTKPIQDLVDGVTVVSKGNLDHRIQTKARGEMKYLVESINSMIASLKENRDRALTAERIAAWQDVARTMAHEIKNPLWPIQLSIRSLRRSYKTDKENFDKIFDECTNTIINEVESLIKIIDEFRDFARMPKPQLKDCDINEVVKHTLTLYTGLPEGIEITTDLSDNLPLIKADSEQLSRAFLNIISNAVQAMPNGGKLLISTYSNTSPQNPLGKGVMGKVFIKFVDNGIGMPPEVKEKIFQPYFTTKEGGSGLGMAIVQRIIIDHNGEIYVDSKENEGTTITISLPVGDSKDEQSPYS